MGVFGAKNVLDGLWVFLGGPWYVHKKGQTTKGVIKLPLDIPPPKKKRKMKTLVKYVKLGAKMC